MKPSKVTDEQILALKQGCRPWFARLASHLVPVADPQATAAVNTRFASL
jgi:hypothetical protein